MVSKNFISRKHCPRQWDKMHGAEKEPGWRPGCILLLMDGFDGPDDPEIHTAQIQTTTIGTCSSGRRKALRADAVGLID